MLNVRAIPASQVVVLTFPARTFIFESTVENPRVPATKIIEGFIETMSFKVSSRQIGQFDISAFFVEFQAKMSEGQHEDIVKEASFHFFAIAKRSIAGNQESAWLSPNKTIVVLDFKFP